MKFSGESGFTEWSEWSLCSATCGDGLEVRTRECKPESPKSECVNASVQNKSCYHEPCPGKNIWSVVCSIQISPMRFPVRMFAKQIDLSQV